MTNADYKELYEEVYEEDLKIYEIIEHYYGNSRVDFQPDLKEFASMLEKDGLHSKEEVKRWFADYEEDFYPEIIIHFPQVTVTNENGQSVDIQDLWTKVQLNLKGEVPEPLSMIRSTYTINQFIFGYRHSHLPAGINRENVTTFYSPCLGSGPLFFTMENLRYKREEETAPLWTMFCFELDNFTKVESLRGGPYMSLSSLGSSNNTQEYHILNIYPYYAADSELRDRLIQKLLSEKRLRFKFVKGKYEFGMSDTDFAILVSEIAKDLGMAGRHFNSYVYSNYNLSPVANMEEIGITQDRPKLLTFKGKDIKLRVLGVTDSFSTLSILNSSILSDIKFKILYYVNNYFKG